MSTLRLWNWFKGQVENLASFNLIPNLQPKLKITNTGTHTHMKFGTFAKVAKLNVDEMANCNQD